MAFISLVMAQTLVGRGTTPLSERSRQGGKKKGVKKKKYERVYTHGSDMPSVMADARLQIGHATTMPTPFYGTTMPTCRIMLALLGGRIVLALLCRRIVLALLCRRMLLCPAMSGAIAFISIVMAGALVGHGTTPPLKGSRQNEYGRVYTR